MIQLLVLNHPPLLQRRSLFAACDLIGLSAPFQRQWGNMGYFPSNHAPAVMSERCPTVRTGYINCGVILQIKRQDCDQITKILNRIEFCSAKWYNYAYLLIFFETYFAARCVWQSLFMIKYLREPQGNQWVLCMGEWFRGTFISESVVYRVHLESDSHSPW